MKTKLLVLGFLGSLVLFGTWIALPLPPEHIAPSWTFYDRHGEILFTENIVQTQITQIPEDLKTMLVAVEDQNFSKHFGVDFVALLRATYQNLSQKEVVSGASTITMQLARLKYLPQAKRNLWYKIKQVLYAFKLEWHLPKETILEEHLQRIYFGNGTTGIAQASQRYFSKTPQQLSLGEKALLLGIIPNPSAFNPIAHPEISDIRKRLVLDRLKDEKIIDQDNYQFWKNEPIKISPEINHEIIAPHFVFWVKDQLSHVPYTTSHIPKEIHVHTTLDKSLYQANLHIAHQEITQRLKDKNLHSSGVVILDNASGNILTMIGSINFFDKDRDGAVNMSTAKRQSGSILKPFLYALALEKGWSPLSEIIDEPLGYQTKEGQYNPRNFYAHQFYGRVRMREALVNSYNLSAVYLFNHLGVEAFEKILNALHLDINIAENQLGLGSILGSGEVSLLNLTNAYRTFPNHGQFSPYQFVTKVTDQERNPLIFNTYPLSQAPLFSPSTSDWITHALSDNQARYKLFGQNNILEIDRPASAKTGTSQEFKDNWVVGSTPQYTIGVWVGNPDGSPLHTSSGIEGAGPIWNKIMRKTHQDIAEKNFSYTSKRIPLSICRRPYLDEADCAEKYQDFVLDSELHNFTKTKRPPLRISFPSDGDIFHPQTQLLLQAINTPAAEVQFYLDGQKTDTFIPHLSKGPHTIWVESEHEQSEVITIFRE
ncbi:MAG TPA: transglycosylase domain-containing protein [Candidatus Gracilibacteria bacterium]